MYIKWDNDNKFIQLPILPSSFTLEGSMNNVSMNLNNIGEINLKGKRNLYTINVESFFPAEKLSFQHGNFRKPYEIITDLKHLFNNNTTVHLIISGTRISLICTIESFNYGEAEKNGDVNYSLTFKEYRYYDSTGNAKRQSKKTAEAYYTWKKDDTWQKITKRAFGSSSGWKKNKSANKNVIKKATADYKKKHPNSKVPKDAKLLVGYKVLLTEYKTVELKYI